jgi:hypothetical protein
MEVSFRFPVVLSHRARLFNQITTLFDLKAATARTVKFIWIAGMEAR